MLKKLLFTCSLILVTTLLNAQDVAELYVKFNGALVFDGDKDKALNYADQILNSTEKLPAKMQTNFYAKLAKVHESKNEPDKALTYWEKVLVAEPDYYVAHRAVAYLYIQQGNTLAVKINASRHDAKLYEGYFAAYKKLIKLAVYHLEKAQSCDPDEASLNYIKHLYGEINDTADVVTLPARLKNMSGHCVTLLTD
jgi:tetratricopeptide (TPR) repeat protein